MSKRHVWLYALATTLGATSGLAPAQVFAQSGAAELEEIVVTARRREENLQTVPIAITAFSNEQLRQKAISSGEQLQFNTPNLTVQASSGFGRTTSTYSLRGQSVVGTIIYRDDVPQSSLAGSDVPGSTRPFRVPYYDLESLQIAHGPQGTLYGRNTTGGAVIINSAKPTFDFNGYVQGSLGNYDLRDIEGALNMPLIADKLAIRVAGKFTRRDGYTKNLATGNALDDDRTETGRISLLFTPSEQFSNTTMYEYFNREDSGGSNILIACNPSGAAALVGTVANGFPVNFLAACADQINNLGARTLRGLDQRATAKQHLLVNTTTLKLTEEVTLKNIFGYRRTKANIFSNATGTLDELGNTYGGLFPGLQGNAAFYTEEFQIQGDFFDGDLTAIAGFFYEKDDGKPQDAYFRAASLAQTPFSVAPFIPLPPNSVMAHQRTLDSGETKAAYFQFTFKVRPKLSFTAGYRYSWDEVAQDSSTVLERFGQPGVQIPISQQLGLDNVRTLAAKSEGVNYNFSIDYQMDPDTLFYITHRRGYRPGGANGFTGVPPNPALAEFGPETVIDTEIGAKKDFNVNGVRGRLNVAAFHDQYQGVQRIVTQGLGALRQNAESATIKGLELEGRLIPTPWLELSGHFSYLDAEFDSFISKLAPFTDLSDAPFSLAPKHNWSATAQFHLPVPEEMGRMTYSVTMAGRSSQRLTDDKFQIEGHAGAYHLINMRLDWNDVLGRGVDIAGYINNVTNKTYIAGSGLLQNQPVPPNPASSIQGYAAVQYGDPRMYGVQLRYRFGAR
jgi:iron complex outermembrane recepter protein